MLTPYSRNTSINRSNNAQSNSVGLSPSSQQVLLRSDFTRYDIAADGDCLFRSVLMGLAERPGVAATREEVVGLRQQLADYISQNHQALSNDEVFRADNGLQNLYGLSLTTGAWADNAGDLVAPLLAQILGREINILQPIAGTADYQLRQVFSPNNERFPAVDNPPGGAPLYLLQEHLSHYSHLKKADEVGHRSLVPAAPEIENAAEILLTLAQTDTGSRDNSPSKQAWPTIKQEPMAAESARTPQPSLVSVSGRSQRFYFTTAVDIVRAQTYTDISGSQVQSRTTMPVGVVPIADSKTMSRRPIVQAPDDPNKPHPEIPQPTKVNFKAGVQSDHRKNEPALTQALDQFDQLLQFPQKRQDYEHNYFALTKIRSKNLPETVALDHSTLGMRGVVAKKPLSVGSPLQYSAQYLSDKQWQQASQDLSVRLQAEIALDPQQADEEAARLLVSYSWQGVTFNHKHYELSAFGASNITAMINHDSALANMGVAYVPSLDEHGQPGPRIVLYFALRDIAEGEQLLVNYGESYRFDLPIEGRVEHLKTPDEPVFSDVLLPLSSIKDEPTAAIETSRASSATENDNAAPVATSNSPVNLLLAQKYQQPPAGYESFKAKKKSDARSHARRFLKAHKLPIAEWADLKEEHVPKSLRGAALKKYQQPPKDYRKMTSQEKSRVRRRVQNLAEGSSDAIPQWAQPLQKHTPRPELTDPRALERPEDYPLGDSKKKASMRYRARKAATLQQAAIPEWAREKYMHRASGLIKPDGYEGMDEQRQRRFRAYAHEVANKKNVPIPEWAKEI